MLLRCGRTHHGVLSMPRAASRSFSVFCAPSALFSVATGTFRSVSHVSVTRILVDFCNFSPACRPNPGKSANRVFAMNSRSSFGSTRNAPSGLALRVANLANNILDPIPIEHAHFVFAYTSLRICSATATASSDSHRLVTSMKASSHEIPTHSPRDASNKISYTSSATFSYSAKSYGASTNSGHSRSASSSHMPAFTPNARAA
mmetsp:Transcript_925/g.3883  ORF Transcript_925/g.3883 Transcript_925/m.3883 type:complete len:203 (+) Transcript_925:1768-2376(+)